MRTISLFLLAATLPSSLAVSQAQLIGLGYDPAGAAPPSILQQTLCQPGNRTCPAAGMVAALPAAWAGGAAYNGRNESEWTTDGLIMVETRINGCQVICRAPAMRTLGAASFASGLEICPGLGQMFQLESLPGAAMIHVWNIAVCPPVAMMACQFPLPSPAHTAGAVAIDDANGHIFYAASIFGAGGPANVILGALLANPCNIVCTIPVQACNTAPMGPIRGMCFDECRQTMYVTDGNQTLSLRRTGPAPCAFVPVQCCNNSPATGPYAWVGIDVEPQHARPVGASCLGPNCTPCPAMTLGTVGDPVLGNPTFQLALSGAPVPSVLALAVSPGACVLPGLPVLCGLWYPNIGTTLFFPIVPVAGAAPCQGTATVPLPIPKNYALCGAPLCFQGVIACVSATGTGFGLTNAVDVVLN